MSDWTQVGENLVRHRGGKIYLRAKVNGKVIRVSLKTTDLRIAKIKRDDRLAGIRKAKVKNPTTENVRTVGEAVAAVAARILSQPELKGGTVAFYKDMIAVLTETLPVATHGRSWTAGEASAWWKRIAGRFAPQRANQVLGVGKRVGKILVELGLRVDDPTEKLKRLKIPEADLHIPSLAQVNAIVESIRGQKKANSDEAADYIEFLAFAGCRHGQAKAFEWKHDEGEWLKFPSGITGTKGAATRRLPISPPLRAILARIRKRTGVKHPSGPIFKIQTPRAALTNACKRLNLEHVRIHDLRHFFTTFALECGVDVPTVAKWLGHKDGGKLVLKTYSHVQDHHSLASAKKLVA